jgi:cell division septum initiation protein DivIVA
MDAQSLQELRAVVEKARSLPMSTSAVISRTEVLGLVDQLQARIRDEFSASDQLVSDRDSFLVDSRREAQRIVSEARREQEELISETDVYKVARRDSEWLRSDAEQEASALRKEIDEYVDQRLANLEISLNKTLEAVTRGRDRLQNRSGLDRIDEADDDTPFPFAD